MADLKKVISHLQIIHTWASFALENDLSFFTMAHMERLAEWTTDTLKLLKEQEPVKPKSKVRHGANSQIQHFCGNCNSMLHGKPKYCSECGKGVKWE